MTDVGNDDPTVLIVEDERELADTYARWLEPEYTVHTAYTGEDGLATLENADVDAVLLDRRLPGLSGDEVLAAVRDREMGVRVAMLTAIDTDYDIIEMEFDDYVTKPVLRDELRELVERLLALDEYDQLVRESYSLSRTAGALRERKSDAELEAHDEYQRLEARLGEVRDRMADLTSDVRGRELFQLIADTDEE